jgi:hypothetical protein
MTSPTETMRTALAMRKKLKDDGVSFSSMNKLQCAILDELQSISSNAKQISSATRLLESEMRQAAHNIDTDVTARVNSLGLVQSQGANIDRLCAVRAERLHFLQTLLNLL